MPLPAKTGWAAGQAARLGVLARRARRQGQKDREALGGKLQDDGQGLVRRCQRPEAASDPARAETWNRADLEEISLSRRRASAAALGEVTVSHQDRDHRL